MRHTVHIPCLKCAHHDTSWLWWQAELGRKMGALQPPLPVPLGYVKRMAYVQPIAKKWREGKADRLKLEMIDLHVKLRDDW